MSSNYYWVCKNLLSPSEVDSLFSYAVQLKQDDEFRKAKIGKAKLAKVKENVRGDFICWVNNWDVSELEPIQSLMEEILQLGKQLYLPLKRYETHLTHYPPGTRYARHIDRHKKNPSRLLSAVIYLSSWSKGDGGELIIYDENLAPVKVAPEAGTIVVFDSDLEHEVALTHKDRWSVTSWFRDDIEAAIAF